MKVTDVGWIRLPGGKWHACYRKGQYVYTVCGRTYPLHRLEERKAEFALSRPDGTCNKCM